MSVELLYRPAEALDRLLSGPLDAAPLPLILALAALLGLRHALDPDHLVAVTSLVAARRGDVWAGVRIGAWWGAGHAGTLLVLGVPMILLGDALPPWVEPAAEKAIGIVIAVLGIRLLWTWRRSGVELTQHVHPPSPPHRHAHHRAAGTGHRHRGRTPLQAASVGALHGLAGSGAVVVLLLAALPGSAIMIVALTLFAATSVVAMALCTGVLAWTLTRPRIKRAVNRVLVPGLAVFAVFFGAAYAGA